MKNLLKFFFSLENCFSTFCFEKISNLITFSNFPFFGNILEKISGKQPCFPHLNRPEVFPFLETSWCRGSFYSLQATSGVILGNLYSRYDQNYQCKSYKEFLPSGELEQIKKVFFRYFKIMLSHIPSRIN